MLAARESWTAIVCLRSLALWLAMYSSWMLTREGSEATLAERGLRVMGQGRTVMRRSQKGKRGWQSGRKEQRGAKASR